MTLGRGVRIGSMRNDAEPDWGRLADYLSGEATPEQRAAVEQWADHQPERRQMLHRLGEAWAIAGRTVTPPVDTTLIEAHVLARIVPLGHDTSRPPVSPRSRGIARGVLAGMAGLLGVVLVGLVIRSHQRPTSTAMSPGRRYVTGIGQRATVRLSDGSSVTLAPQSTLTLDARFGGANRVVALSGEALFTVPHDASRPFIVRTAAAHTRVLGTSFDIRQYADSRNTRVVVTEGRVAVTAGKTSQVATLSAGTMAEVSDSTVVTASEGSTSRYTGWTQGRLDFTRARLSDVLAEVQRWYGYRFQVADSTLVNERLTVTLDTRSTADMFTVLRTLLDISVTFVPNGSDTVVVLRRRTEDSLPTARQRAPRFFSIPPEVGR